MAGGVTRASGATPPNVQAYWPGSGRSVTTRGSAILGLVLLERVEVDEPDLDHPAWVAPVQVDQVDHAKDHESAHARSHVGVRRRQRGGELVEVRDLVDAGRGEPRGDEREDAEHWDDHMQPGVEAAAAPGEEADAGGVPQDVDGDDDDDQGGGDHDERGDQ